MVHSVMQADAIPDWVIYLFFTPFFPMWGFVHVAAGIFQVAVFLAVSARRLIRSKNSGRRAKLFWVAYLPFFIVPNVVLIGLAPSIWQWLDRGGGDDERRVQIGDPVDELNGVSVFYNGPTSTTKGRHTGKDGYNFGLRYQCVEFVKRYYYEKLGHRMPVTWGHARDFFDKTVPQGTLNSTRGLWQYRNGDSVAPAVDDLIVFGPSSSNPYGHVAIVSEVNSDGIEITQQNPGPGGASRVKIDLEHWEGTWRVQNERVLGWLRVEEKYSR